MIKGQMTTYPHLTRRDSGECWDHNLIITLQNGQVLLVSNITKKINLASITILGLFVPDKVHDFVLSFSRCLVTGQNDFDALPDCVRGDFA